MNSPYHGELFFIAGKCFGKIIEDFSSSECPRIQFVFHNNAVNFFDGDAIGKCSSVRCVILDE